MQSRWSVTYAELLFGMHDRASVATQPQARRIRCPSLDKQRTQWATNVCRDDRNGYRRLNNTSSESTTVRPTISPNRKMRRNSGASNLRCMYQPTTSVNLTAESASSM
jgi:hypothetical protein